MSDDDALSSASGVRKSKAPFPWFGGSQHAAPLIWEALGDPSHYVDPFCGSLAVPLLRPHPCNRTYYSETFGDADGLLCNAWRAIARSPDATAEAASWPVCEADVHARHLACLRWAAEGNLERLMADPTFHDAEIAGYWLYGICAWIGSGWCSGDGPWVVGPDGRIVKRTGERGVSRKIPHLANNGRGVHRPQLRERGVAPGTPDRPWEPDDFHPMVMPELRAWLRFLSARLRHARIVHGDWRRLTTTGAVQTLPVRSGKGHAGIFLDPPYTTTERAAGLYACDEAGVAEAVRAWCLDNGANPRYRIVLKGFAGEGHEILEGHGWRCVSWFTAGWLRGGMGNQNANGHQQDRERLWLSPHCATTSAERDDLPPLLAYLEGLEEDAA